MAKIVRNTGQNPRCVAAARYDAHHTVLDQTYGALADLRRELSDSKAALAQRTEILNSFADCADSQRAWLLLEDYFEKLALARKDFPGQDWWPALLQTRGRERLEATAILFLKCNRPLPTELVQYANFDRLSEIELEEKEQKLVRLLEQWLVPRTRPHLDSPRASLRVICQPQPLASSKLHGLKVEFGLSRPRTGEKIKTLAEMIDLSTRPGHEQELFSPGDWEFISWLPEMYSAEACFPDQLVLAGLDLLRWLVRWGQSARLQLPGNADLHFCGELAELAPLLETAGGQLILTKQIRMPGGVKLAPRQACFFGSYPTIVLVEEKAYLLRNAPPPNLLEAWLDQPPLPVKRLSHRLLKQLRKSEPDGSSAWEELCVSHGAVPQFVFELEEDTVRLRLMARSELDQSFWEWNGEEWQRTGAGTESSGKPEILDDQRLEPAVVWLRRLDWFTPEPGLWVGDADENFLQSLALAWPDRPEQAEYLGNPEFQRLFLKPRRLRPNIVLQQGSGIDWFSVSAAWEAEGLKLTSADLERLKAATSRFVKLPDSGWIELDSAAVQSAHEMMADLGLEGLSPVAEQVPLVQARQISDEAMQRWSDQPQWRALRDRLAGFTGIEPAPLPASVQAVLRPYQKEGYDFLCHQAQLGLGGILADDMGLGKTLQTLCWLAFMREQKPATQKPALVICPASVLHNWQREAQRFTPNLKVLVLESGRARHNLRKQIPQHDIIVTNYALLRRDLAALGKFQFRALILDEAQFIKNPTAQVTICVKQLRADHRLALTGTPLENRLLDLWSIVDFVQPGYLGSQSSFTENYEPKGPDAAWAQKVARRRLSAKLRPLLLRRLKRQVAQDLPDRIEERRDCDLGEAQRKLYLAELRRSREQVFKAVREKGLARSKIHVLAALTRLRQICCHPRLVGNDSGSGKTETLFELLEPLLAEGQKVLVFSQFVEMLRLLEGECQQRQFPTYILTGETKQRHEVVNSFQADPNAAVFLLSLRAAGTGLNLTTASYVVLYDPWWNPAVEAQAIDRSHRIGQTRTVNAYQLIAPGTVEEKIWELQQRKAQTIMDVLGEEGFARSLSGTDLDYLFSEE
jgi:SNF2 family DNA or RNA helicase